MKRRLPAMLLLFAVRSMSAAPPGDPAAARVDEYLSRIEGYGFSGVIVLGRGEKVLLEKGYGLANREEKIPFGPETVVNTGSITKQFTGAAILKLEMQGKLRTSDVISRFFPEAPADKSAITVHHLLTHTAGLRHDYGPSDDEKVSREEIVSRILTEPLASKPGAVHSYSNAGYSLLAAIVEKLTGGSYEAYLARNLFAPAGMTKTGYVLPAWPPKSLAVGYRDGERWGTIPGRQFGPEGPYWNLRGNGGLQTTVGDMWRWHRALLGTDVLSAAAKEKLFHPWVREEGGRSSYGYGWSIAKTPRGTTVVMHNGGNGIYAADCRRYLDEGLFWFVASNGSAAPAIPVSDRIAGLVFGREVPLPPQTVAPDPAAISARAGTYELTGGGTVTVAVDAGRLALSSTDSAALSLLLGGGAIDPQRAAGLRARSVELATASSKGNVEPVWKAFGGSRGPGEGMPIEAVRAREAEFWNGFRERNGELRGVQALAVFPFREEIVGVLLRLEGAQGTSYVQYGWEDGGLAGIRPLAELPAVRFVAVKGGGFARFDFRSGQTSALRFEGDTLVLPLEGRELRATRK
ncbi:MAG: serine hydrolase [Acidobacteria bacterium]|nr:serine hydrolase [Acidobacteriota bacterium]